MWNLEENMDVDQINTLLNSTQSVTLEQFNSLVPHLRINYVDNRFQTMMLTEWAVIALSRDDKQELLECVLMTEQWIEFDYVVFKILIKVFRNREFAEEGFQVDFIERVFIALNSKEFVKVGFELFACYLNKYTLAHSLFIDKMKIAIKNPLKTKTLIHSLSTQVVPHVCKIWKKPFLDELQSKISKHIYLALHLSAMKCLLEIKESGITLYSFAPYMKAHDEISREIIFTTMCKVKKTSYFYHMFDIKFILKYIESGDPQVAIDYIPYFCSHIYYAANTNMAKYGSTCEIVVGHLRDIAMKLLRGDRGEDHVEVGGFLYHILSEVINKNNVKTAYPYKPTYAEKASPLCIALIEKDKLLVGSDDDILMLTYDLLEYENAVPILKILIDLERTPDIIGKEFFFVFLFERFTDPSVNFIQEKVDVCVEFMMKVYHPTFEDKLTFFVKWLKVWKAQFEGQMEELISINQYLTLRAILDGIKRHDLPFESEYCSFDYIYENIDQMCKMMDTLDINDGDIRTIELVLTTCADLLIQQGQHEINEGINTIRDILSKLETIINCNKRYVTATVTALYRKFVSVTSPLYIDFYREYVLEKIASINPEITKRSKQRRGAEHRAIIHSICAEVPKKYKESIIDLTIKKMRSILTMKEMKCPEIVATAIHCLNQIMEDRSLKQYSAAHVFDLLQFCLDFRNSNQHFAIRNARYLLFKTLTFRILPSVDRRRNLGLNDVFRIYPKLLEITIEMGNSDDFDRNTKIMLISLLMSASELNKPPLLSDYRYNILPTCVKMLKKQFHFYLVLDLIVSVIPVGKIYETFFIVKSFLLNSEDILLQDFYNHLYILKELYDKLLLHVQTEYCRKCFVKLHQLQESMRHLKSHKTFPLFLKTGLIVDFENLQKTAVNVNFDDIPKSICILNTYLEKKDLSETIKITAANILLNRVEKSHPYYKEVLLIAIKVALLTESVGCAKNLIIELIHILCSSKITNFPEQILQLISVPYETLVEKTKQCIKYIFLHTYLISCYKDIVISSETKRLILDSFYCREDEEAAAVFHRIQLITKNRTEILLIGIFTLIVSDFDDNYICQRVFDHFNIVTLGYKEGITKLLSLSFLKKYLHCPKAIQTFLIEAVFMLNSSDTKDLFVQKQFMYVKQFFQSILCLFFE